MRKRETGETCGTWRRLSQMGMWIMLGRVRGGSKSQRSSSKVAWPNVRLLSLESVSNQTGWQEKWNILFHRVPSLCLWTINDERAVMLWVVFRRVVIAPFYLHSELWPIKMSFWGIRKKVSRNRKEIEKVVCAFGRWFLEQITYSTMSSTMNDHREYTTEST